MSRVKGACKGNGEEPAKESGKTPETLESQKPREASISRSAWNFLKKSKLAGR